MSKGGLLKGEHHNRDGNGEHGIPAQTPNGPIEMESQEVVVTKPAVLSKKKVNFNGKQMTNCEVLSEINQSGGGVKIPCDDAPTAHQKGAHGQLVGAANGAMVPKATSDKKYYNTHGYPYSWEEFIESEVEDRENYTKKEVAKWKKKYGITDESKLIWVTTTPQAALAYKLNAESQEDIQMPLDDFLKKWDATHEWVDELYQFTDADGTIITESEDGDDGFLMLLNETGENKYDAKYDFAKGGKATPFITDVANIKAHLSVTPENIKHVLAITVTPEIVTLAHKWDLRIADIKDQLRKGIEVETEHTHNLLIAKTIALQHLDEMPDYYTQLAKIEGGAEKKLKGGTVRNILYRDEYGKAIVYDKDGYKISVNNPDAATYIALWHDGKKVGHMALGPGRSNDTADYTTVSTIDIEPKHRGKKLGLEMYRAALSFSDANTKGIGGENEQRSNNKQVPAIYRKLGGHQLPSGDFVVDRKLKGGKASPNHQITKSSNQLPPHVIKMVQGQISNKFAELNRTLSGEIEATERVSYLDSLNYTDETIQRNEVDFILWLRTDPYRDRNVTRITIEKDAAEKFGITNPDGSPAKKMIKNLVEFFVVLEARRIATSGLNRKEKFDAIVSLYKNQFNLSHRDSDSVLWQQYSTPMTVGFLMGEYCGIGAQPAVLPLPKVVSARKVNAGGGGYKMFKGLGPTGTKYEVRFDDGYSTDITRAIDRESAIKDAINYRKKYSTGFLKAWESNHQPPTTNHELLYFEPSAGTGSLTIAGDPSKFYVNEIDPYRARLLRSIQFFDGNKPYLEVTQNDASESFKEYAKEFNGVLTNPPFGQADYTRLFGTFKIKRLEHVMALHALETMRDDGRAAIIVGGNNRYEEHGRLYGADMIFLNYLTSHYHVEDLINIDGSAMYTRMGTSFDVRVILINGRREKMEQVWFPNEDKTLADYEAFSTKQVKDFDVLFERVNNLITN